ncbi:MAG: NifB/NifX family molybdenum-iron cluster-binding protein [Bacteroidales bacterium]|nr:NifB/NifX family molybdenum-iron cluster-binding protein [Bacteroidales bacterium]HOK99107.1 NifB/NifX family molybdenum-iron cluster-binding protein [Bacteroidales bacterium]HPO65913.1 NifB/NifX family molybdenum-iron cluster-binding protein [Bacteroidales bacterium]
MKIVIAANENHVKSDVAAHFGRCDWFCIFDTETKKAEFIANPVRNNIEKAGLEAANFLINKGLSIAVAGRFGAKVVEIFRANNVQMIVPESQVTINEIIKKM